MSNTTNLELSKEKPFEMGITLQIDPRIPKKYDVYRLLESKVNSRGIYSKKIVYVIYDAATKEKVGEYGPERFAEKLRGPKKIAGFHSYWQFDIIDRDIEFNKSTSTYNSIVPRSRYHSTLPHNYASEHGGKRKTKRSKKTLKRKHKKSKTYKRRAH